MTLQAEPAWERRALAMLSAAEAQPWVAVRVQALVPAGSSQAARVSVLASLWQAARVSALAGSLQEASLMLAAGSALETALPWSVRRERRLAMGIPRQGAVRRHTMPGAARGGAYRSRSGVSGACGCLENQEPRTENRYMGIVPRWLVIHR